MFSPKIFDSTSPLTVKEVASAVKIDGFEQWLSSQEFNADDPVIVFEFLTLNYNDKMRIVNALVNNHGQKVPLMDVVFKFATWPLLINARRNLLATMPQYFYSTAGPASAFRNNVRIDHPTYQTVRSMVITYCSEKTDSLNVMPYEFFEL
ncbi:hypothetical protein Mgra_00000673 [Meloidogyne graminicola]|uniref:Uncharacterized protein n=1 Tax=Meloidogyne graminicola TaxID=189291 RepID=A0A8T0A2G9_9BILA|nr:hypothetical protein Mgra_00000673 [Meloidogyne graminicola]